MKIAVLGGGFTGLVGAYRLALLGHEVYIIEKSSHIGGLASGFQIDGKYYIEKTYHHIFTTDVDVINLINELNLNKYLNWYESTVSIFYNNEFYSFSTPFDLIKIPLLSPLSKFRFALSSLFLKYSNNFQIFENITAYEWLLNNMGVENFNVIWRPLLIGKFGDFYDKISMAWLWARIHTRINSRKKLNKEVLGYMHGSFGRISNELRNKLKSLNVELLLNSNIEKIIPAQNKVSIYLNNKKLVFDKVFCTFSNPVFINYFEGNIQNREQRIFIENLKKINYLDNICLVFSSSQNLSNHYWHNINDLKIPFLVFVQHTNLINSSNYGNKHVYYIGKYIQKNDILFLKEDSYIVDLWFNALKEMFPKFNRNLVTETFVFKFKDAQHVVGTNYLQIKPKYNTPFNNIYLVNFSQIYPEDRGINFAVREGNKFPNILLNNQI